MLLLLLGLSTHDRQSAAGQTPQPTPPPDPRYAEAEKAFAEAVSLYAEHTPESMKAALELAERARRLFNESSAPTDEALSLLLRSHIYSDLDDKRAALLNGRLALPIIRRVKEKALEASTLRRIGELNAELDDQRKALEAYEQALVAYRKLNDKKGEAATLNMISRSYRDLHEYRQAVEYLSQALPLLKVLGDKKGIADALNNAGALYTNLGEKQKALEYLSEALPLMKELGDKAEEATTLYNLGTVYQDSGERQKALECDLLALSLYKDAGDQEGEAAALYKIGRIHLDSNEPRKALETFNQTLPLKRALGDKRGEALALFYIGKLYEDIGDPQKALDVFSQALPLYKERGDRQGASVVLNRLGGIYDDLGDKQKALEYFNQALSLRSSARDRVGELVTLGRVGAVYRSSGESQKALEQFSRALLLAQAAGDRSKEAETLNNIGLVYDDLGEKQKALEYLDQALRLGRAAGDRGGEATTLNNIGKVYDAVGEAQKALEYLNQALSLNRAAADKLGEGVTLNNIAMVYYDLGEKQKALDHLTKALELYRAAGERRDVALVLGNIGLAYIQLGEQQKALDYINQALQLCRASGDKAAEGRFLSNIATIYLGMGEREKAVDYYTRALPIRRLVGDKVGEATTLYGLSEVHYDSGAFQKSLEYLHRALLLERAAEDRRSEVLTLSGMATVWGALKNRRLAIFFGKQAVARCQELRGAMRGVDRTSQQSFLKTVQEPFRQLTALLLEEGRLAEAQQVLNIFKDQEFYDSIRPDDSKAAEARRLDLTRREREAAEAHQAATDRVAVANRPLLDLEFRLKNRRPSPSEERQLIQFRARAEAAGREAEVALRRIEVSFALPAPDQDKLATTPDTVEMQSTLRELSRKTDSPTVALYTIGGDEKFHVLLVTPDKLTSVSTPVNPAEFVGGIIGDRRIKQDGLWLLLQSPFYDPRPQARAIYDIVFKPVAKEIELVEAEAKSRNPDARVTIMWSLDWYLRYIPMGVLYDGEHYLAERYRNVVVTRANRERMTRPVGAHWAGLGFGSTAPQTVNLFGEEKSYDELPGAELELAALFGTRQSRGIMTGQTWLNEQFTKEAFLAALKQRRPLVHLASHFTFEPGDETRSFLLLGSGEVMTLEEMKTLDGLFTGVDLLTLSACNTGAQRFGAQGREVDGFAELAQRLGAGSVLATLWPVPDEGTPELMVEFYRLRQEGQGTTKAEALRLAQLALLKGTAKATPQPANGINGLAQKKRGRADILGLTEEPSYTPRFHPDPKAPYAHPYYWGAFVLIGNAL
ncbi:MAG TPA: tetratricopeptide repeat protein [Pyrinomonadaceae bacterium]